VPAPVRIALAGYGLGGRYFHAPLIASAANCEFLGVVTTSPERRRQVAEDLDRPAFASLEDLASAGAEAVAISTPAATHVTLTQQALRLGLAVVCDKHPACAGRPVGRRGHRGGAGRRQGQRPHRPGRRPSARHLMILRVGRELRVLAIVRPCRSAGAEHGPVAFPGHRRHTNVVDVYDALSVLSSRPAPTGCARPSEPARTVSPFSGYRGATFSGSRRPAGGIATSCARPRARRQCK
jgi:hypothetical protein